MKLLKYTLSASVLAGVFGFALASLASGPIMISPVTAPIAVPRVVSTANHSGQLSKQLLNTYRQVRTFWLSRGIVR